MQKKCSWTRLNGAQTYNATKMAATQRFQFNLQSQGQEQHNCQPHLQISAGWPWAQGASPPWTVIYQDKRDRESNHDQDRPRLLHQRLGVGKHRLFCSGSQHLHVWSLPNATHLLTLLTYKQRIQIWILLDKDAWLQRSGSTILDMTGSLKR